MTIFVSYARLDEDVVKLLAQGLETAQREVWFDHDLRGGEVWWVKILQNIRQAEVVIFALSDNFSRSKPCRAELDYAVALNRPILPIKVGPVTNFRANPLSAIQTLEFRPDDSSSGFEIIAAVDEARKRLVPLPDDLPPEPPLPFAYLIALSKQIDSGELTPRAQLEAVDELRKMYREETDTSVHADILATLRSLKTKGWATMQAASEVDAVLAWAESRARASTASGTTPAPVVGPSEDPVEVAEAKESAEEDERRRRREFEQSMAEALKRQLNDEATQPDPDPPVVGPPPRPRPQPTEAPVMTFRGVSAPLVGGRTTPSPPQPGAAPSYFARPHHQQGPAVAPQSGPPPTPIRPATTARPTGPPAPAPRPYWGWSLVGVLGSFVFGFIALYFSNQVGARMARGDRQGAQSASGSARAWGIVGLVVGVLWWLIYLNT